MLSVKGRERVDFEQEGLPEIEGIARAAKAGSLFWPQLCGRMHQFYGTPPCAWKLPPLPLR